MNNKEFFAAVVKMRNEQKNIGVKKVIEKLETIKPRLATEIAVDDEIARVEKYFENNKLEKFW